MNKENPKVPCVMYHSVGIPNNKWHWKFLTCPYQVFEDQLKWIKKAKYKTLNYQEVYDYIMNDKPIPNNSVFLTFDDGYLDNYVFVYPLLKKYGMKGTIFVNPDFVDPSEELRMTLDDTDSVNDIDKLDTQGFCNWNELREIDKSGVLDVQSHAKTHTWYPTSDKIIDFRHPKDEYIWMDWNEYPKEKPYLQCINKEKVKLGSAIFEHEKSLSSKRVFISPIFQQKLQKFVNQRGGESFFNQINWKEEIKVYAENLKNESSIIEKQESQEEYLKRIQYELEFTKNEIEKQLNKKINFLCWPGGSATKEGVEIADKLGYLMSTAARDIPKLRKQIKNSSDNKINRISRFTPVMFSNFEGGNSKIKYSPGWFLILQFMKFQNRYYAGFWVKVLAYIIIKLKRFIS